MTDTLLFLRAPERSYVLDWEVIDDGHEALYEGPREDALVALQKILP
ncbi:MAG: hypothetical protein ACYDDF_12345 [Thermoplasmatota archaeon]